MASPHLVEHVGRVLGGRYRLLAPVGTGASANVFVADDATLRRRVAVKILHAALARDEPFLRRFRAEAQAAAALNHPHVMRVFDWGETEDGPFLVLEYLGGGSLRDLLDAGHRLSPEQAALVGIQAGRALDYAHRRGLVHRDIKPANLLFDDEGRVCIADFGIARALAEAAWTEPTGAMVGTARYASPEQVRGSSLDGKADVYSLALSLVESVTGQVPFSADTTIATLMGRVETPLRAPDELSGLASAIEKAGAVEPDERIDAAGFTAELEAAASDLPSPAKIPLVGAQTPDATTVIDRDPTLMPSTRPKVADFSVDEKPPEVILKDRSRKKRPAIVAAVVAALLVLGAGGAYGIAWLTKPSHPVPVLRGKTLAEARQLVDDENFNVEVADREYDEEAPEGTIVNQDPASGEMKEGRAIRVVLSRGPAPRSVPDLAEADQGTAERLLAERGLVPKIVPQHHEEVAQGLVMDWQPRGDQSRGTEITVTVSAGPAPRTIPNVMNLTYEEAAAQISALQLVPTRGEAFSDTVPEGQVAGTNPGIGKTAPRDSTVTILVSKGPNLVTVPDVRGDDVDSATSRLEAVGLVVTGVQGNPRRRVSSTSPGPGTQVKRGSGVTLRT